MSTFKLNKKLTTAMSENITDTVNESEMNLVVDSPEDNLPNYSSNVERYRKACDYRSELLGGLVNVTATRAKEAFSEDDSEVTLVNSSLPYADTNLHVSVHKEYSLDESDEPIKNHVVINVEDDFTQVVNEACIGILD